MVERLVPRLRPDGDVRALEYSTDGRNPPAGGHRAVVAALRPPPPSRPPPGAAVIPRAESQSHDQASVAHVGYRRRNTGHEAGDIRQKTGDRGQGKGNRGGWSSCYQQFIHFLPHTLRCTTKEALQHPYSGTGTNTRQLMRLIAVSKRFNPSPICGLSCQNLSHTIPRYFHPECVCSSLGLAYQGIPLGVQRGKSPK